MSDSNATPVTDIIELAQRDCRRKRLECRTELALKLERVDRRLDRKHDQLLVLVGADGNNGRVGQMRKEIDANRETGAMNKHEIWAMKFSIAKWAGGSTGIVLGLTELIKFLVTR